ncbi:hypothetical protein ACBJ59_10405 [Nonomuraea sp. MTCD27]|uniref:hypothetical protein n=1 Tax=Nonomuraea sp. MTCD27 TaxID=1676747 RepID=UPI0035BED13A
MMHDTPDIRIPGQRPAERQHQPWCDLDEHVDDTCFSADMVVPPLMVRLTWSPGQDVRADVATSEVVEVITLDALEQRALAMLTTALLGRGVTPPANAIAAVTS